MFIFVDHNFLIIWSYLLQWEPGP